MRAFSLQTDPFPDHTARGPYFDTPALAAQLEEILDVIATGHVLLVDEAGSGKSAALERFAAEAAEPMRAFVVRARRSQDARGLSNALVSALGLPLREPVAAELRDADTFLELLTGRDHLAVIVIDDAHRLEGGALEQLLYLCKRWQHYHVRFLIGAEPELCERLDGLDAGRLLARATRLSMPRLDEEQIGDYLNLCLVRAGLSGDSPFDAAAVSRVAARARGLVGALHPIAREVLNESMREGSSRGADSQRFARRWGLALATLAAFGVFAMAAIPGKAPTATSAPSARSGDALEARSGAAAFRSRIAPRSVTRAGANSNQSAPGGLAGAP